MKTPRLLIVLGLFFGLSRYALAVPCDGVTTCERPGANATTQAGWVTSASGVASVKALVSAGATGNQVGSQYYFGGSNADLGATVPNGSSTPGGAGARVISTAFATNGSQTPTAIVSGGSVQQLLGNTLYFFYSQACPDGTGIYNSPGCSDWTRIGSISTLNYPSSVFSAPVAPADATVNTLSVRAAVPVADLGNVSLIRLDIHDLITPANNQTLAATGFSGNITYPIDNTMYTQNGGFKPNVKYEYLGRVSYPYNINIPSAGQTRGPFWTTPVNPGTVTTANITHCSVQITALNSSGSPSNPAYTDYSLCAVGTAGDCEVDEISGATAGDSAVATVSGLNPGTAYTPRAQALVGNGDGSQGSWASSGFTSGAGFSTLPWGGTFTIGNVTSTSADFTISGLTGASSIANWAIKLNGSNVLTGSGDPTGTHTVSGRTPNTVYGTAQIVLTETSGCSSTLNFTPTSFTTTPVAPTAGTITAPTPRSLQANFTDGSANPNGVASTYEVQRCLDAGFSSGCASTTGPKAAGASQSITINTGILPETQYFARVRTRNQSRLTWPDSAWFNLGNVTTPNEGPNITAVTCGPVSGSPSTSSCSGTATDNGPLTELLCHWSGTTGVTFNPPADQAANNAGACPAVTATFPGNGSFTVTLTVTDKNGAGIPDSQNTTVSVGVTPTTIVITPNTQSLSTAAGNNQKLFTAIVCDQFEVPANCNAQSTHIIAGQAVTWDLPGGGGTLSTPNPSSTITFTATTVGTWDLRARVAGATDGHATITVASGGPLINSGEPTLTIRLDKKSGSLTCVASDPDYPESSLTYSWQVVEPAGATATFSANGNNAARSAIVDFTQAGTYRIQCTARNPIGLEHSKSTPQTALEQVLTIIDVTPKNITVNISDNPVFTATGRDQFGAPRTLVSVQWDSEGGVVTGAGSAGVYNPNTLGTNHQIRATSEGVSGVTSLTVVNYDVSAARAYPVPYKSTMGNAITFDGLGSSAKIRIFTASGREIFTVETTAGSYPWAVVNSAGEKVASGVYLYVIESPQTKKNGKLIIIQ